MTPTPADAREREALLALSHRMDDAAQHVTECQVYDFATELRVLLGLDGQEARDAAMAATLATGDAVSPAVDLELHNLLGLCLEEIEKSNMLMANDDQPAMDYLLGRLRSVIAAFDVSPAATCPADVSLESGLENMSPAEEPVAWAAGDWMRSITETELAQIPNAGKDAGRRERVRAMYRIPLYTAPPPAVEAQAWAALTDEDRQRAFESMPDMLEGFMKKWGWLHFAKAIEAICREKNGPATPHPGASNAP